MIPRIIHQIWIGNKKISKNMKEFSNEIRENNRDFDYIFWDNRSVKKLFSNAPDVYQEIINYEVYAFASDFIRLFILRKFGGIYLDMDIKQCNRKLIEYENINKYDGIYIDKTSAIMMFTKGHDYLQEMMDRYVMYYKLKKRLYSDVSYIDQSLMKKHNILIDYNNRNLFLDNKCGENSFTCHLKTRTWLRRRI